MMSRRKIVSLFMAIVCIGSIFLYGCGASASGDASGLTGGNWYYDGMSHVSGEAGVFYTDTYLRFFDGESGQDVLVCDKADCAHDDDACPAYFNALVLIPIPEESGLLLITDLDAEKLGEISLFECSVNGENRKKIASFSHNMQFITDALWTDEYIILTYYNQYDENYEDLEKEETGIFVYDRKEKSGDVIWSTENLGAQAANIEMRGDKLYFYSSYSEYDKEKTSELFDAGDTEALLNGIHSEMHCVDISSGEDSVIETDTTSEFKLSDQTEGIYVIKEENLEYWKETDSSGADSAEILFSGENISMLDGYVDGMMFFTVYDPDTEKKTYYVYDEEKQDLSCIGEAVGYGVFAILKDRVYAYDYNTEDGNGKLTSLSFEDFLKGDFTDVKCADY